MKETNISKVFTGFLIASAFMWLLINLSKESTSTLKYEVSYEQLAQNKILQEEPVREVDVLVKATGFKLLSANFSNRKLTFLANKLSRKTSKDFYFLPSNQRVGIQKQLPSGVKLEQVLLDTIHLKLGKLASKKVPVLPNTDIQYQIGYNVAGKIKVTPDSVLISGPELQLKNVKSLSLEKLQLENVSEDIKKELTILAPENTSKIKFSNKKAEISIVVDKFTEGELEIPITVKNIASSTKFSIYPKNVTVTFKVGLKDFNSVQPNDFKVVCDYKQSNREGLTYLVPKLKSKPDFVSSVRMSPKKIDFLIHK